MRLFTRVLRHSLFDAPHMRGRLHDAFQPRKPRHRVLRAVLAVVGLAVLAVLIVAALVVGGSMLLVALAWRSLRGPRKEPPAVLDAEYRVVPPPALPISR